MGLIGTALANGANDVSGLILVHLNGSL
jgi:hypothetical protein